MALKGTLKDFSLADIFQLIGIQQKTGVLTLKRDQEIVTVSFVGGAVVGAESLRRRLEDRIGTVLVKTGQLSEAQLQEALKIQKETLNRLGNVLVDHQLIDVKALREALQTQINQTVFRLFRWGSGEYDFSQDAKIDYDKKYISPTSAENILMEGVRILDEWPMIEKGIRSFSTVFRRADVEIAQSGPAKEGGSTAEGAVTLNKEERIVHTLVDGKRSVQEVVESSLLGEFETCRILYELINRQLLEETGRRTRKAPSAAVPAPSRTLAPIVQGFAYLILILLTGAGVLYRATPWIDQVRQGERIAANLSPVFSGAAIASLNGALEADRLKKIDFAIQVFFLLDRTYPADLADLVAARLLNDSDVVDAAGRRYQYEMTPDGYRISASALD